MPIQAAKRFSILLVCFAVGALACAVAPFAGDRLQHQWASAAEHSEDSIFVDPKVASSEFTPEKVVELQIKSMRESLVAPDRLITCYSLASPKNREMTGPFARFASMVTKSPYDQLARCSQWQIGSALIQDDYAAVLVTTLAHEGEPRAIRFFLNRQRRPPYEDCWLTDAVHVLQPVRKLDMGSLDRKRE